jgi:hypothetical protein
LLITQQEPPAPTKIAEWAAQEEQKDHVLQVQMEARVPKGFGF